MESLYFVLDEVTMYVSSNESSIALHWLGSLKLSSFVLLDEICSSPFFLVDEIRSMSFFWGGTPSSSLMDSSGTSSSVMRFHLTIHSLTLKRGGIWLLLWCCDSRSFSLPRLHESAQMSSLLIGTNFLSPFCLVFQSKTTKLLSIIES